ncbi:MAG: hypothetical protein NC124_14375 [Clostridium sp.]|nr:hypothetical protein [Clostridium sp.]
MKKQQEELHKEQELLMQLYRIINARDSKKKQSENDSIILLMREIVWLSKLKENPAIWEKVHDCTEMEPVTVEVEEDASAYKQMTLFGMENAAEKQQWKKEAERCVEQWCREAKDSEARELMLCWCEDKGIFLPAGEKKRMLLREFSSGMRRWEAITGRILNRRWNRL